MNRFASSAAVLALAAASACLQGQIAPNTAGTFSAGPNGGSLLYGHTEPVANVEVPAGMKGQLLEIDVKEGQTVKKGDPLAKLDDAIQQATVELAKEEAEATVSIRYVQNQLASAQNDYAKVKNNPSFNDTEKRQKELDVKQAELAVEKAQEDQHQDVIKLKREQITLDHMTIRSPIDGSVLRVNKQAGEETDDNPLAIIVQTNHLNAVFFPPKQLFGKVHVGDKVTLNVEGQMRDAVVVDVDPIIDQASELFRVKMEFDNADGKIAAGSAATWTWKGK
jgi:RND family efflux transporter MFP subunit